ncbi:MAG: VWA domain-containing protein [Thermoanaerobaculia bacterium]
MKKLTSYSLVLLSCAGLAALATRTSLSAQPDPAPKGAPPAAVTAPVAPAASAAVAKAPDAKPGDAKAAEAVAPAGSGDFFESIDVSVVNVDVFVTDKKGNRIKGLTRKDFDILEDKKPMAISNFYAVDEGKPVPTDEELAAETVPALPVVPGLPPEIPEDQRLHLVVYIDNFNLHPFSRNKTFPALREFLRSDLSPGDQVMLMSYERESHIRRPFTSDPQVIASALFELEKVNAFANTADSDRRELLSDIEDAKDANVALSRARSYSDSLFNDLQFSIDSLKNTVSSLAGLPGRKAILYVSDGLPMVAGQDVFQAIQEKFTNSASTAAMETLSYDASRRFQELIAQANANRISFYTIDGQGLQTSSAVSAENRTSNTSGMVESVNNSNMLAPLQLIAESTGGKAIYNTNDATKGLMTIAGDFKSYYSLGYSPVHSGDGRYHKIEVRTKRKDLVVRHREGYRDKTTEAKMSDGVVSSLFYDVESNAMAIQVQRGQEVRRDDGFYTVPIEVRIPIGNLVLVPVEGARQARVRVFFAAMNEKGDMSETQNAQVPIRIPEADVANAVKQVYVYSLSLMMRRGPQKVAVGVRDEVGATQSFTIRTMNIGAD